jgi:hypothetical protein
MWRMRSRLALVGCALVLGLAGCGKKPAARPDAGHADPPDPIDAMVERDAQVPDAGPGERDAQAAGGASDAGKPPPGLPKAAELCPRVIDKIIACSYDKKFLDSAFVFSKQFEKVKPIKVREFHADVTRWRKGGKVRALQCEAWQTNLYDGAGQMDDAGQLLKLLGAASLGCAPLGKLLTDQGGLPQLVE